MIYRRKIYKIQAEILEEFNGHFNKTLLPTQLKYGARLVGRWMTNQADETVEVFAIWEYDSYEDYERIEKDVKSDEAHVKRVQAWYSKMGNEAVKKLKDEIKMDFVETTVPRDKTILSAN